MMYSILENVSRVPLSFLPTHEEIMAHYPSLELLLKTASLSTIHHSQDMETIQMSIERCGAYIQWNTTQP